MRRCDPVAESDHRRGSALIGKSTRHQSDGGRAGDQRIDLPTRQKREFFDIFVNYHKIVRGTPNGFSILTGAVTERRDEVGE